MKISQLLTLQNKKKQLENKKQKMLNREIHKKKLQQINIDKSSIKRGFIEKTKIIQKKQFDTFHQKARTHIPTQIQENTSVCSYLMNNENYKKIYTRTTKIIQFDSDQIMSQKIGALKAYGLGHHQKVLHLKLIFQKQINCGALIRPFAFDLPYKINVVKQRSPIPNAIILVKDAKIIQSSSHFKNLMGYPISVRQYTDFLNGWKHDKQFKKNITQNKTLLLCQWEIFKDSSKKLILSLLQKNYVVFPFDIRKVPFFFTSTYPDITYEEYLKHMLKNEYALISSGQQHVAHLKMQKEHNLEQTIENVKQGVYEMVAKLIQRNKNKTGNHLVKAELKTHSSINLCIYQRT